MRLHQPPEENGGEPEDHPFYNGIIILKRELERDRAMETLVGKCLDAFSMKPGHTHLYPVARRLRLLKKDYNRYRAIKTKVKHL